MILSILLAAPVGAAGAAVDYVGTHVWTASGDPQFGGFSAIEISDDGNSFHALTDRANIYWGTVSRDSHGRIRGMELAGRAHLRDSRGIALPPGRLGDSEGLAIGPDGVLWVSFEGLNRIAAYDHVDAPATRIVPPPEFDRLPINEGFEALAIDDRGTILTLPEYAIDGEFPVWRYDDRAGWQQPFAIPADSSYRAVGADFGPDGRFYLLERRFGGLMGFTSRVRRFELAPDGVGAAETLLETRPWQYDNLEGISVWADGQGLRLTLVSDDNFLPVQRTELVEYRIAERVARD